MGNGVNSIRLCQILAVQKTEEEECPCFILQCSSNTSSSSYAWLHILSIQSVYCVLETVLESTWQLMTMRPYWPLNLTLCFLFRWDSSAGVGIHSSCRSSATPRLCGTEKRWCHLLHELRAAAGTFHKCQCVCVGVCVGVCGCGCVWVCGGEFS